MIGAYLAYIIVQAGIHSLIVVNGQLSLIVEGLVRTLDAAAGILALHVNKVLEHETVK